MFFVTNRSGKYSISNTCCQLFITDKGYVYVIPMKSKIEVLQGVNQFAKDIGSPETIICNISEEHISKLISKLFNGIGTTVQVLKERTLWGGEPSYIYLINKGICPKRYEVLKPTPGFLGLMR